MSADGEKGPINQETPSEVAPFDEQAAPQADQPPTDHTTDSPTQITHIEETEIPPNGSTFESTEDPRPVEPVVEPKPESPHKQAPATPVDKYASKAKDLGELLLSLATEKKCPDHNQPVVTICTNFTCTRRFWCGICCVKYKDLYVRHNSDMTLIEDFLSENLSKLYKVKTCMEGDKQELETLLDKLQGQLENHYHDLWTKAEVDIDKLKQEIITRLETNRAYLKERHDKWLGNVHDFFGQVKSRVRDSPVRDCGAELELLRKNVEQSHDEVLGVIETIGNKVTKDISLIEDLNKQFAKIREFIGFLESQFDHVRDQTSPSHVPLEKDIASLGTRFDQIASIKIRGLLEEPRKDLTYLLDFHGSLFGSESGKGGSSGGSGGAFGKKPSKAGPAHATPNMYREGTEQYRLHAMMDLLHTHDGKEYSIRDSDDSTHGSSMTKNSRLFQERRTPNLAKDGKKVVGQAQPVADRDKDYARQPIPQNLQPVSQPQVNPSRPSQTPLPVVKNPFAGLGPITPDLVVDPDRMSFQISTSGVASSTLGSTPTIFDGNLAPVYSDVELDIIEKLRSVVAVTDAADQQGSGSLREQAKYLANFVPVLYSHQNNLTFASKSFTDAEGEIIHSFNVYMTLDDSRGDQPANPSCIYLESGEEVYWSSSRITQFTVMEREFDQCSVLCVASEDSNIKFIPFQPNANSSKVIEFLDGMSSCQLLNDSPTTLKRYGRSDLVVCTTSGGDILVIDSLQGEILYNDKQCEGSISSACFVQENAFFLIGSGSNDAIKHDNSLTFLSVNSAKVKEDFEGIKPPTFKYKVRVKKAHGDTFGVICVAADNSSKVSPIVFSAGGKDDPCIKVWNFESKELIKTIETKEGIHHLALQLIVTRAASDSPSFLDKTGKGEIKGAWKNRAEEITNFQKMRDENKKRKIGGKITESLPHGTLSFILVDVTNRGLRAYKINLLPGSKQPPTTKDIGLSLEIKSRLTGFAFGLSQLTKLSDECFLVQLATPNQKIDLFTLKLASA